MNRSACSCAVAMSAVLWTAGPAGAQGYPVKPIRMIAAFAAGTAGGDVTARLFAARTGELLGQTIVVENQGGAGGAIAAESVSRAAPDGYTLLFTTPNALVVRPFLTTEKAGFDAARDFTPIAVLVRAVFCLAAHPSVPANSVKELVEHARRNPNLAYATSGVGSFFHLSGELFQTHTGVKLTHVPYKGSAPGLNDVVAGQVPLIFASLGAAERFHKAGKLKILAVISDTRDRALPEVATMSESLPGYHNLSGWLGVLGPAGLPRPVLSRLNTAFVQAATAPDIQGKLEAGMTPVGNTPEQFAEVIRSDLAVIGKVVKSAGIKPGSP